MKWFWSSLILLFFIPSCYLQPQDEYSQGIIRSREERDSFFKTSPNSPLPPKQHRMFFGLHYFSPDSAYRVTATVVDKKEVEVALPTPYGSTLLATRVATVLLKVKGQQQQLYLYSIGSNDYWLLPFTDETNGESTSRYGRVIEVEPTTGSQVVIDFNNAYNVAAEYNERLNSALSTQDNHIPLKVEAGEESFR